MLKAFSSIAIFLLISACTPVSQQDSKTAQKIPPAQCIESQSQCEITTEFSKFTLKFSQIQLSDKIKTELPFTIELSQQANENNNQLNITKVSSYLEGRDMFMGKVPVFFEQNNDSDMYTAQSLLANCTEEQMIWRLWITVESEGKAQNFFVDFTSQRL
ncbi:MAG: hypothetical protein GY928_14515 [Colwellia sp.]|nr:hypothetical protein [Colwellia sp.]